MTAVRNGIHPFDEQVGNSGMLGWVLPTLELAVRRVLTLLPVCALACLIIVTARYWLPLLPKPTSEFGQYFFRFLATLLSMSVAALGYCMLAIREGSPYGLGGLARWGSMAARLTLMLLISAIASTVLGWTLRGLFDTSTVQALAGWVLRTFGPLNGIFILLWLLSPLMILLGTISTLCNVMCMRTELGVLEIIGAVFTRVFEQIGRLLLPGLILSAFMVLFLRLVAEAGLNSLYILGAYPNLVLCSVTVVGLIIGLCWWFVLERAWLPEAGLEPDLDEHNAPEQMLSPSCPPLRASRPEPVQLTAAQALELTRHELQVQLGSGQVDVAVHTFIAWLRTRQRSVADLSELLGLLHAHWPALAQPLSAVTAELARNNRSFEAVHLTRYGVEREPAFLGDQPDTIPAYAKRLVQMEHPDLAIRLLATYVRLHRTHPGYLGAGLLLARLLMSHANQPEAARKLLNHLQTLHPQEMQIDLLLRQLGPPA